MNYNCNNQKSHTFLKSSSNPAVFQIRNKRGKLYIHPAAVLIKFPDGTAANYIVSAAWLYNFSTYYFKLYAAAALFLVATLGSASCLLIFLAPFSGFGLETERVHCTESDYLL